MEPPLKTFKAINMNLTILEEYGKELGEDYWAVWEGNCYKEERESLINQDKVMEIAERLELPEKAKVQEIATMLEYGADLGIEGGLLKDPIMSQSTYNGLEWLTHFRRPCEMESCMGHCGERRCRGRFVSARQ